MNEEIGNDAAQFPRKGIHKWDFRCSAAPCDITRPFLKEECHSVDLYIVQYSSSNLAGSNVNDTKTEAQTFRYRS